MTVACHTPSPLSRHQLSHCKCKKIKLTNACHNKLLRWLLPWLKCSMSVLTSKISIWWIILVMRVMCSTKNKDKTYSNTILQLKRKRSKSNKSVKANQFNLSRSIMGKIKTRVYCVGAHLWCEVMTVNLINNSSSNSSSGNSKKKSMTMMVQMKKLNLQMMTRQMMVMMMIIIMTTSTRQTNVKIKIRKMIIFTSLSCMLTINATVINDLFNKTVLVTDIQESRCNSRKKKMGNGQHHQNRRQRQKQTRKVHFSAID